MAWPTINKFNNIMSYKIKSKLLNTSQFIKEAMFLRKNTFKYNCFTLFCGYISLSILNHFFLSLCACV